MSTPGLGTATTFKTSSNRNSLNFSQTYTTPSNTTLLVVTLTTNTVIPDTPLLTYGNSNISSATRSVSSQGTCFVWTIDNPIASSPNTLLINDSNNINDFIVTLVPINGSRKVKAVGSISYLSSSGSNFTQTLTTSRSNSTILSFVECDVAFSFFNSSSQNETNYLQTSTGIQCYQAIIYDGETTSGTSVNYNWATSNNINGNFAGISIELYENTYSIASNISSISYAGNYNSDYDPTQYNLNGPVANRITFVSSNLVSSSNAITGVVRAFQATSSLVSSGQLSIVQSKTGHVLTSLSSNTLVLVMANRAWLASSNQSSVSSVGASIDKVTSIKSSLSSYSNEIFVANRAWFAGCSLSSNSFETASAIRANNATANISSNSPLSAQIIRANNATTSLLSVSSLTGNQSRAKAITANISNNYSSLDVHYNKVIFVSSNLMTTGGIISVSYFKIGEISSYLRSVSSAIQALNRAVIISNYLGSTSAIVVQSNKVTAVRVATASVSMLTSNSIKEAKSVSDIYSSSYISVFTRKLSYYNLYSTSSVSAIQNKVISITLSLLSTSSFTAGNRTVRNINFNKYSTSILNSTVYKDFNCLFSDSSNSLLNSSIYIQGQTYSSQVSTSNLIINITRIQRLHNNNLSSYSTLSINLDRISKETSSLACVTSFNAFINRRGSITFSNYNTGPSSYISRCVLNSIKTVRVTSITTNSFAKTNLTKVCSINSTLSSGSNIYATNVFALRSLSSGIKSAFSLIAYSNRKSAISSSISSSSSVLTNRFVRTNVTRVGFATISSLYCIKSIRAFYTGTNIKSVSVAKTAPTIRTSIIAAKINSTSVYKITVNYSRRLHGNLLANSILSVYPNRAAVSKCSLNSISNFTVYSTKTSFIKPIITASTSLYSTTSKVIYRSAVSRSSSYCSINVNRIKYINGNLSANCYYSVKFTKVGQRTALVLNCHSNLQTIANKVITTDGMLSSSSSWMQTFATRINVQTKVLSNYSNLQLICNIDRQIDYYAKSNSTIDLCLVPVYSLNPGLELTKIYSESLSTNIKGNFNSQV